LYLNYPSVQKVIGRDAQVYLGQDGFAWMFRLSKEYTEDYHAHM